MPDMTLLLLSVVSVIVGGGLVLYPETMLRVSGLLNRTLTVLDQRIIRHRYVFGALAFLASYAFFKLALLLPTLRG